MLADVYDERARPDPFAGGGDGVKIVDGAVARVPAVHGVPGGAIGALGHRLVELAVVQAGEGPGLIDDLRDRVGEGRVADAVEDHGADGDLALIGLPSRLGGDEAGQEVDCAAAPAAGLPAGASAHGHTEGREGLVPHLPVRREAVFLLEPAHGLLGLAAVNAVHRAEIVAPVFKAGLDLAHGGAGGAPLIQIRRGALRQGNDEDVHGEDQRQGQHQFFPLRTHKNPPTGFLFSLWRNAKIISGIF